MLPVWHKSASSRAEGPAGVVRIAASTSGVRYFSQAVAPLAIQPCALGDAPPKGDAVLGAVAPWLQAATTQTIQAKLMPRKQGRAFMAGSSEVCRFLSVRETVAGYRPPMIDGMAGTNAIWVLPPC